MSLLNIFGDQRVYNRHHQLNTSLRQSMLFLGVMMMLKCVYIEANFVFLHVQMLFWISAELRWFSFFLHYVIQGSFKH